MHHTFLYISLLSLHNYDVKMPIISRFVEDVNTRQLLSFSFPQLGYNLLEFNSWIPLFHACGHHTPSFWVTGTTCFESIDTICQIWPIRGYTRNWCTGTGCLKKWLQAPPPLLSPVSPRFIFVFALSQFNGTDHLGAWNRLPNEVFCSTVWLVLESLPVI